MRAHIRLLLRALLRRDRFEREMDDEMRFHMEAYAADLMRRGVPPEAALRRARLEFGGVESLKEQSREARGLRLFDELSQDLTYAARGLRRKPVFATSVIASLALGIGANTAIFSLMDAVLFRTLPVADPERLYYLAHSSGSDTSFSSNYPLLERYRASEGFSGITAYSPVSLATASPRGPERVSGQFVSGNYHSVLGVPMVVGRGFSDEPDRPDERAPIAVISFGYWDRNYGRSEDVIGQTLSIGGRAVTIVGVTAPGFNGLVSGSSVDVTLPMSVRALDESWFLGDRNGWTSSLALVGQLDREATAAQALASLDASFRQFWMEPENAWAREGAAQPARSAVLLPADKGSDDLRGQYSAPLRVLMGMVGIVLAIACANVANLQFAQAASRAREVAVRLGLGAGRARLIRQLLTESVLLAGIGGTLGFLVALAGARAILASFDAGESPVLLDVRMSGSVLLFTLVVCLVTGVASGLAPALKATRVELTQALKGGAPRGRRRVKLGKTLVAVQIALCMTVFATTGLLVRSLYNLRTFDAGFERDDILLFNVETTDPSFAGGRREAFHAELLQRVRRLPGVIAASYSRRSPLDSSTQERRIDVPGFLDTERRGVSSNEVTPDYFRVFGIRVLRGRGFSESDGSGSQKVALVNEAMARHYFGSMDPLGREFLLGGERESATIVGIVEDARHERLRDVSPASVYTLVSQPAVGLDGVTQGFEHVTVAVRTTGERAALAASLREQVRDLSSSAGLWYVRTMHQQLEATLVRERLLARLSSGFGLLAVLLAFVGLYGLMSYSVARRVRELGIRIALGATRGRVQRQILRETLQVSTAGMVIGLLVAVAATPMVEAYLFELSPRDPVTFWTVTAILVGITVAAGLLPARRAAAVEPMRAMSAET
jgi:predicted permease